MWIFRLAFWAASLAAVLLLLLPAHTAAMVLGGIIISMMTVTVSAYALLGFAWLAR